MFARSLVLLLVAPIAGALAAELPSTVSPGGGDPFTLVTSTCPTFSWGAAPGARAYEVAVWEVESSQDGWADLEPVLQAETRGAALSWTQCWPGPASSRRRPSRAKS